MRFLFTSDLHGKASHYLALADLAETESPDAILLGGDLLPNFGDAERFVEEILRPLLERLDPHVLAIMGNDDPRVYEALLLALDGEGLLDYVPMRSVPLGNLHVAGYPFVPPTPFQLKDWERYDVSRYVGPGEVSPEEGARTVPVEPSAVRHSTISQDLEALAGLSPPEKTVYLFHSPPYGTGLDRANLDGCTYDHAPLDVHVGSVAIRDFIIKHKPLATLHGHIHESTRLTGRWMEVMGTTHAYSGAHDGPGHAFVLFDTDDLASARRVVTP